MTEKRLFGIVKGHREHIADHTGRLYSDSEVGDLLNKLSEENEQLKLVVKEVLKLLEEEVDLFTNKATEHDLNAYIELRELDNKDAYYMATATKKAIKMLKEIKEGDKNG